MPRNGSGTASIPNSFTPATTILSSAVNANFTDVASMLTASVASDGQTPMSGALRLDDGSEALPGLSFEDDTNTGLRRSGTDVLELVTGGADRVQIDANGKVWALGAFDVAGLVTAGTQLVAGHTAALSGPGGNTPKLQAIDTDADAAVLTARFSADANPPHLDLVKSRHASIGSHTIVQSGDTLGDIRFAGSNGTSFDNSVLIQGIVDGTPGALADMPGTLVFSTSADASATPTERMAIRANGKVQIPNRSAPLIQFDPSGYVDLSEISEPASPASDVARLYSEDVAGVTTISYKRSDGQIFGLRAPTQAEMETATSVLFPVTPGRQHFHPGHPKFWGYATVSAGTPTLQTSYNVTSITDTDVGKLTVTIATDFSSANWASLAMGGHGSDGYAVVTETKAAGTVLLHFKVSGVAVTDPTSWNVAGLGDQA